MRTELETSRYEFLLPDVPSVPSTIEEAQALRDLLEENLYEDDLVPRLFQHPCPTCRVPVVQRPPENYFAKDLVEWFHGEVEPCNPAAQMSVEELDPPLFDGLFLDL